jgi:hypothetical protein
MQIAGRLIDFSDRWAMGHYRCGRPTLPLGTAIPAAMRWISARKARQTADNACLAREMTATCQGCIGESSGKSAIEGDVRPPKKI